MARLPEPGGDSGQWGDVLNDYLSVAHNADGTIKNGAISNASLQNNAVTVAKIATTGSPSSGQSLTYDGSNLAWSSVSGSGSAPDANASTKGLVQLTGDLGGTAASPTVPGLAAKENAVSAGTTGQYYRGDKSWQTLNQAAVNLSNVNNTSDADKPISTATQAALDGKAASSHTHNATDINVGTLAAARLPQATAGELGAVQLTGDLGGTATAPTVPGLSDKEDTISTGTTSQYYRGDKSWQTLDKTAVGLSNVENTTDANKPISTATQTALAGKASSTHTHAAADIASGTIATARLPLATDAAAGITQLASVSDATTGTDEIKAVTPKGLSTAISTAITAAYPPIVFVDAVSELPPGTPVDTLVVVRGA